MCALAVYAQSSVPLDILDAHETYAAVTCTVCTPTEPDTCVTTAGSSSSSNTIAVYRCQVSHFTHCKSIVHHTANSLYIAVVIILTVKTSHLIAVVVF
jgi:hypothetical protein